MSSEEKELVARAVDGDKAALAEVVHQLQDPIYRLALRMVWRPADAEDATQEILIRVVTRLATWRAEAKLLTWAYRIGVNYLLNLRRQTPQEQAGVSLDAVPRRPGRRPGHRRLPGPDAHLLAEEVRLTCTQAMLQCLERGERVAFVLADVFELSSTDAAWILDITPAAYRKRLARARQRLRNFMARHVRSGQPGSLLPMRQASRQGRRDRAYRPETTGVGDTSRQRPRCRRGRGADAQAARRRSRTAGTSGLRGAASENRRRAGVAAVRKVPDAGVRPFHLTSRRPAAMV